MNLINKILTAQAVVLALWAVNAQAANMDEEIAQRIKPVGQVCIQGEECKGVAGYRLLVASYDIRESVTVISPDGRQHPLDFTRVITLAPSMVGEKAEWRVEKRGNQITPIALIVRVYADENPDAPNQRTSYLSVSKITPDRICVTAKIRNSTNANEQARQAAAVAAYQPCLR